MNFNFLINSFLYSAGTKEKVFFMYYIYIFFKYFTLFLYLIKLN